MTVPSSYLKLTRMQRAYVDARLQGLTQVASATAAGCATPKNDGTRLEKNEDVQAAMVDMMSKTAEEVGFSRKEAHDMYMEAYQNAETATEQIAAVNAMVKLHGLEKPKQLEVKHEHVHSGQIEHLPTEELMRLAGMEKTLTLEGEYQEIEAKPVLEAPEVTEDNTIEDTELQDLSDGYRAL